MASSDYAACAACAALIESLGLIPHPEGGYYKESYKSKDSTLSLPERFGCGRGAMPFLSSIYYLLAGDDFSAFHRIKSDELWYFHAGTGIRLWEIGADGRLFEHRLGPGAEYFCAIGAGNWFSAEPLILGPAAAEPIILDPAAANAPWALVGCAVSPGFDFCDFELAKREELAAAFPRHRELIERLTRYAR
jgi:predicted cupin superfamily sugar epimerase